MFLAILFMNICAVCATGMTGTYRIIANEGFHAADFNLLRNILLVTIAIIWCSIVGVHPIKQFPWNKKLALSFRVILGQINFCLLNLAAPLAPISLVMVCW